MEMTFFYSFFFSASNFIFCFKLNFFQFQVFIFHFKAFDPDFVLWVCVKGAGHGQSVH